jgi:hypothetical protein
MRRRTFDDLNELLFGLVVPGGLPLAGLVEGSNLILRLAFDGFGVDLVRVSAAA